MTFGQFVWTDLSTYHIDAGRADYAAWFNWSFTTNNNYAMAQLSGHNIAAIYPMPSRMAEINMPSFWMSYVRVANIDNAVKAAQQHQGAIIEVKPQWFDNQARVALVRDPSGAGFTLYEGPDITPAVQGCGTVVNRYLHVADIGQITDFYEDLFGWSFTPQPDRPWPTFKIQHPDGHNIAVVEAVPDIIKGKFNYWMPCFGVDSVDVCSQLIQQNEGSCLATLTDNRLMVSDRQGAHFIIQRQ